MANNEEAPLYGTTWYEEGQRKVIRGVLQKRFGPLAETTLRRLEECGPERLEELEAKCSTSRL